MGACEMDALQSPQCPQWHQQAARNTQLCGIIGCLVCCVLIGHERYQCGWRLAKTSLSCLTSSANTNPISLPHSTVLPFFKQVYSAFILTLFFFHSWALIAHFFLWSHLFACAHKSCILWFMSLIVILWLFD